MRPRGRRLKKRCVHRILTTVSSRHAAYWACGTRPYPLLSGGVGSHIYSRTGTRPLNVFLPVHPNQERQRQEAVALAASRQETLRALRERVGMDREDKEANGQQGRHFFQYLEEAEAAYAQTDRPFLRALLEALGLPPVPRDLRERVPVGKDIVEGNVDTRQLSRCG